MKKSFCFSKNKCDFDFLIFMLKTNEKWQKSQMINSIFKIISNKAFLAISCKLINCYIAQYMMLMNGTFVMKALTAHLALGSQRLNLSLIRRSSSKSSAPWWRCEVMHNCVCLSQGASRCSENPCRV